MDSCEEDDHAGNAKNTSANTHLVLGLVVQACSASYFRAGSRRIKSLRPPWAIEGVQEQPGGIYKLGLLGTRRVTQRLLGGGVLVCKRHCVL